MAVSSRTMKLREPNKCPNCKQSVRRIDKLEQENTRLHDENAQLKQQLAAARKNSSTSSKPPSAISGTTGPAFPRQ